MLKIGLTGGIGSGKTTVAKLFADYGSPVIDADLIAHQLVVPGQPALKLIQQAFGDGIINADHTLNRTKLGDIIFHDHAQKLKLEAILHPMIRQAITQQISQLSSPYCLIAIPLLIENQMENLVDRILVIDCPESLQIERVSSRDLMPLAKIKAIMASQASRSLRLSKANDVIENTSPECRLAEQVKKLHNLYLSLSASQDNLACEHQNHL
ncbi:MAG: dephospho-CoA kinase [Methylococcaceae bacterium]|jgi:dephospho-CoA kinase